MINAPGALDGSRKSVVQAVIIFMSNNEPELKTEGIIRDFIRAIQEERKNRDFNISDRITIKYYSNDTEIKEGILKYETEISSTTLANKIELSNNSLSQKLDDIDLSFEIEKI